MLGSRNLKVPHLICQTHPCGNIWLMNFGAAHPAALYHVTWRRQRNKELLILWFIFGNYIMMTDHRTRINDNNVCFPCVPNEYTAESAVSIALVCSSILHPHSYTKVIECLCAHNSESKKVILSIKIAWKEDNKNRVRCIINPPHICVRCSVH